MKFTHKDLDWAVERNILDLESRDRLQAALAEKYKDRASFTPAHALYYFGGLIVISAMTWFMVDAWERPGVKYHRNEQRIAAWLERSMPETLKRMLPDARG